MRYNWFRSTCAYALFSRVRRLRCRTLTWGEISESEQQWNPKVARTYTASEQNHFWSFQSVGTKRKHTEFALWLRSEPTSSVHVDHVDEIGIVYFIYPLIIERETINHDTLMSITINLIIGVIISYSELWFDGFYLFSLQQCFLDMQFPSVIHVVDNNFGCEGHRT